MQKRADAFKPHIYTPFSLLLQPDSGSGITRQDQEATKVMTSARRVALFGPLACALGLMAVPVLLYLAVHNQEAVLPKSTINLFVTLVLLLLVIVHCSNASTVHHYFSLVDNEQDLLFGGDIRRPSQERLFNHDLKKVYLVVLFALCGVERRAGSSSRAARYSRRQEEVGLEVIWGGP